jgi:hypothetical protein
MLINYLMLTSLVWLRFADKSAMATINRALRLIRGMSNLNCAKAGKDHAFLNEALDEFCYVASLLNIPLTFMNHPTGKHCFDMVNDDARTREIIQATLAFLVSHLER